MKAVVGTAAAMFNIPFAKGYSEKLEKELEEYYDVLGNLGKGLEKSELEKLKKEAGDVLDIVKNGYSESEFKELDLMVKTYADYKGVKPPYDSDDILKLESMELDNVTKKEFIKILEKINETTRNPYGLLSLIHI